MNSKLQSNVFFNINALQEQIVDLQLQIEGLNEKLEKSEKVNRFQMLRIKNGEEVSDDFIINSRKYLDLSPEKAFELYNRQDTNFIILDVSSKDFTPVSELPEALNIPVEELNIRFTEITNRATPIYVISEDGIKSILACEILNECGYYNVNNVSGGYKFWPGFRIKENQQKSA